jgi:hypothetical protein
MLESNGGGKPRRPSHATVVAYAALFVALGGTAIAASQIGSKDIKRDAVKSKQIDAAAVRKNEIKDNAVRGEKVKDDTLSGDDIDEATLTNVDAATLGGKPPSSYLTSLVYMKTSGTGPGTLLASGYFSDSVSCDNGDVALSGGPTGVTAPSLLVNSTPAGQTTWTVTISKNGGNDTFGTQVICLDQTA